MDSKPRLPPEIIKQVIDDLHHALLKGDPLAERALNSLVQVNRLFRHWALRAKFAIVVAPRHVREFRRWIARESQDMIGYNKAVFVALDDISKLTSTSAGWEADLQRLLQRLGPDLTHLSLWVSETRAVLRDPAQIRGPRFHSRMPIETLDDVVTSTLKRRHKLEKQLRRIERGDVRLKSKPLKIEKGRSENLIRAEIAAAKERAKQKIPNWLQYEMQTKAEKEVKKIYKAHIGNEVREYQHELDVQQEHDGATAETNGALDTNRDRGRGDLISDSESSSDSDDDHEIQWGCMPIKLSICPSLPLHEHENVLNFARMIIWTRVEDLEVFLTVPSEISRYLELFAGLIASPLKSFRISSIYASLYIEIHSSSINIARGIGFIMASKALSSLIALEFRGKHMQNVNILELAIGYSVSEASRGTQSRRESFDQIIRTGGGLIETLGRMSIQENNVKVIFIQGNQSHLGRLKDRKQAFLNCHQ